MSFLSEAASFALGGFTGSDFFKDVLGISQAERQEKAQKRLESVQLASRSEEAARARRSQIRQARIRQAEIQNIAGATGQTESSAVISAKQNVTGQAAQGVGQIATSLQLGEQMTAAEGAVARSNLPTARELLSQGIFKAGSTFAGG